MISRHEMLSAVLLSAPSNLVQCSKHIQNAGILSLFLAEDYQQLIQAPQVHFEEPKRPFRFVTVVGEKALGVHVDDGLSLGREDEIMQRPVSYELLMYE